jgi:ech hydrogenase subunit A
MLLPPFGVLMGKWMAMEAGAGTNVLVISLLAMGSALSVVYWARWCGSLMASRDADAAPEKQPLLIRLPLLLLCGGAVVLSFFSPWIYNSMLAPMFNAPPFVVSFGSFEAATGSYALVPLFIILGLGLIYAIKVAGGFRKAKVMPPYAAGANVVGDNDGAYIGPMNGTVPFLANNMYLGELFAEGKLTPVINALAAGLIILMLGGAL